MKDLIERQVAIDAANDWLLDCFNVEKQDRSCGLIRRLEDLPPAQSEHPKGKWIPVTRIYKATEDEFPYMHIEWVDSTEPDEIDGLRCSECGTVYDFTEARNWCSECGADMRGEQDANANA